MRKEYVVLGLGSVPATLLCVLLGLSCRYMYDKIQDRAEYKAKVQLIGQKQEKELQDKKLYLFYGGPNIGDRFEDLADFMPDLSELRISKGTFNGKETTYYTWQVGDKSAILLFRDGILINRSKSGF